MSITVEMVKPLTTKASVTTTGTSSSKTLSGTQLLYPEGLPSTIPDTTDNSIDVNNMSEYETLTRNRRFFNFIPDNILSENRLSSTSSARDCYVFRRNSRKLQETLVDYSYNLVRMFNITQEV